MQTFKEKVLKAVLNVPKGKVVSYGQVAAMVGSPGAARQVGGALRFMPNGRGVPWWRVVNSKGEISIKGSFIATKQMQKQLLEKDGVIVNNNFKVDIEKYRHKL